MKTRGKQACSAPLLVIGFAAFLGSCKLPTKQADLEEFVDTGLSMVSVRSCVWSTQAGQTVTRIPSGVPITGAITMVNPKDFGITYTLSCDQNALFSAVPPTVPIPTDTKHFSIGFTLLSSAEHKTFTFTLGKYVASVNRTYPTEQFSFICDSPPDPPTLLATAVDSGQKAVLGILLPTGVTDDDLAKVEITWTKAGTPGATTATYTIASLATTPPPNLFSRTFGCYFQPPNCVAATSYNFSVVLIDAAGQRSSTVSTASLVNSYTLTPGTLTNGTMTTSATTVAAGVAANITATPSTGYAFSGWSAFPAGNASFGNALSASTTVMLTGNAAITATFTLVPYTVTYNGNGLSGYTPPVDSQTYTMGASVTVLAPGSVPAGSAFAGWNTIANGSGTCYSGDSSDSTDTFAIGPGNVYLYSQWMTLSGTSIANFSSSAATVIIPSGVTGIGVDAFRLDPNLTSLTIPATITESGASLAEALMDCPNLTTITLANGSPYAIENGALVDPRSGGTLIEVPAKLNGNFIIPSVGYIDIYAFSDCSRLTGITLSNSVATTLGGTITGNAFSGMHSSIPISLPSDIATIDQYAFTYSDFTSVTLEGTNVTIQANAFYGTTFTTLVFTSTTPPTTIISGAFSGTSASLQIQVPLAALAAYQADAAAWGINANQIVGI
jgi:BspA type Leucine rich repeat region (6 copies)/Divergent InlB B-repeat domain/Listeria-Bacteroides repeat domain (List_Bact_rpt)